MKRLLITILFIIANYVLFSQSFSLFIWDQITGEPVSNALIQITDNGNSFQVESRSDSEGSLKVHFPDRICQRAGLILRITHSDYATFYSSFVCPDSEEESLEFFVSKKQSEIGCEAPVVLYKFGKVEPSHEYLECILLIAEICKENPDLLFSFEFLYSREEVNGYSLSIKRANYLIEHWVLKDIKAESISITVNEGEVSEMSLQVLPN